MLILEQIPMRRDNYSYACIIDNDVILIDPSDADESEAFFDSNPKLRLHAIFNTHSHYDHIGGNEALYKYWRCPIYGPKEEATRIPFLSRSLVDNDEVELLGVNIKAFDVRAHTKGHMAFLLNTPVDVVRKHGHGHEVFIANDLKNRRVMFVGDSLFAAGCGRLFEGNAEDLFRSLNFYKHQDPKILMAAAHEYTKTNLAFAKTIFPKNKAIEERANDISNLLAKEGSSVPCPFLLEQTTNPFLLALDDANAEYLGKCFSISQEDKVSILLALRHKKDQFR